MKITNKLNLPQALVDAVTTREPSGNYSASMLTSSPRMVWLRRRHHDEITEDVSDRIWALFGTAVHSIIEQGNPENALTEEYLRHEFKNGAKLSGKPDLYLDGRISDWKTVSVWSLIYLDADKLHEYEVQLNTYAFLFRQYGFEVNELEIVMLMRDWQSSKAKFDASYPQAQVAKIPIRLWSNDEIESFLISRIDLFESHKETPDNDLPYCTDKDRWTKAPKWALMKKGAKRAVRLFDERPMEDAEDGYFFEERPGEQWKRCEYCSASPFCNQYQEAHS